MNRRGMFGLMIAGCLALIGITRTVRSRQAPTAVSRPTGWQQVFKLNPDGRWLEIAWMNIKPGDCIMGLGISDGCLWGCRVWIAQSAPQDDLGAHQIEYEHDLLVEAVFNLRHSKPQ